jgi:hypothetical protein
MRSTPRRIILHIIIFIVALVVLALIPIWLGLGPVAHSEGRLTAGISN